MSGRKIKVPALGDIPKNVDPALRDVLQSIIDAIDLREGRTSPGSNTRFVTIQDLVDAGVITDGQIR